MAFDEKLFRRGYRKGTIMGPDEWPESFHRAIRSALAGNLACFSQGTLLECKAANKSMRRLIDRLPEFPLHVLSYELGGRSLMTTCLRIGSTEREGRTIDVWESRLHLYDRSGRDAMDAAMGR